MKIHGRIRCAPVISVPVLAFALVLLPGCGSGPKSEATTVEPKKELPTGGKISDAVAFNVTEARLVSFDATDAALEKRWGTAGTLFTPEYKAWQVRGSVRQSISAVGVASRKWQFVRVVVALNNAGAAKDTIQLCRAEKSCPDIGLTGANGAALPVWGFIAAGVYANTAEFEGDMKEHANGIVRRNEIQGGLFTVLAPGERTWIAILFDAAADPGTPMLKVFGTSMPIAIAH